MEILQIQFAKVNGASWKQKIKLKDGFQIQKLKSVMDKFIVIS